MSLVTENSAPAEVSASGINEVQPAAKPLVVVDIYARKGWQSVRWHDLWEFRDLALMLAVRDVTVRYKQTVLGASWAVIQPLIQSVVLTIFFGALLNVSSKIPRTPDGRLIPYLVFALCGQVLWQCFSSSVTSSSASIVNNANMVSKIYFPRLLMPLSALGAPILDCLIGVLLLLVVMAGYMIWPGGAHYGIIFSPWLLLTPLFIFSTLLSALGIGLLLCALTVSYRDFKYVVPFMIQIWYFVTPVIYPVSILPERFRWLLYLNPMAGTIEAFQCAVLGQPIDFVGWGKSMGVALVLLVVGTMYFSRVEQKFADVA